MGSFGFSALSSCSSEDVRIEGLFCFLKLRLSTHWTTASMPQARFPVQKERA
jgi:hypothetical protein